MKLKTPLKKVTVREWNFSELVPNQNLASKQQKVILWNLSKNLVSVLASRQKYFKIP
jgi:hypothetical protein